ncbi:keratin, type I cytoskeletal 13-like [Polyodon spathula]|uniref:keratin, type I cytoskeletal 13-like n=1 Tax=Polyodon spathula TaxID=7913 RepID=UPI001B7DAD40|nr:keratin, type I cytoskeletal 13-like [Polyodon spathula]
MTSFSSHSSFAGHSGGRMSSGAVGLGSSSFSSRSGAGGMDMRAQSVYGGAGGRSTRISSSSVTGLRSAAGGGFGASAWGYGGAAGGYGASAGGSFGALNLESGSSSAFSNNGKETMHNLNDRLAVYLEKVRTLQSANAKLEQQIHGWSNSHAIISHDMSAYHTTIEDLRTQMLAASAVNSTILLQIDNAKLAAEDFKVKYENELAMRQSVEYDIAGLKKLLSELSLTRSDLEMQIESVKEELLYLKKNHEEELISFRSQLSGQVQVEVDSAPGVDLAKIIADIREQYEAIVNKSRKEAEAWYQNKAEVVQKQVTEDTETLQTSKSEMKEQRNNLQNLEMELQALQSTKMALEASLQEMEARYAEQLIHLQAVVTRLESQLAQMRADMESNTEQYHLLLDIKTHLELEIAEYRRLLDGEEGGQSTKTSATGASSTRKVVTVVQELVDGKVVSSSSSSSQQVKKF